MNQYLDDLGVRLDLLLVSIQNFKVVANSLVLEQCQYYPSKDSHPPCL